MAISAFDLFSIGIGPSSSHTVGPMKAAQQYVEKLKKIDKLSKVKCIKIDLYGSLALTGKGHGTDMAVILGLEGNRPDTLDPNLVEDYLQRIETEQKLLLGGEHSILFSEKDHLLFHMGTQLPYHPNGMLLTSLDERDNEILAEAYYSIGGGFIIDHETAMTDNSEESEKKTVPYPFKKGDELLKICEENNISIAEVMLENEKTWRSEEEVRKGILEIWNVMKESTKRGCEQDGILPGGLGVRRRAKNLHQKLLARKHDGQVDPNETMQWVSLWALAVNEENAARGRVVTAPTNGAAGVIPSVLHYYKEFTRDPTDEGVITFLLTAAAIGILYKEGASISAAEMGCMGEVGVACSMAAGGLTAAMGATPRQVEDAAEIGMEHNLGLTCDPVMGLVQIPCIERNTMGAVKAINASLLARNSDGNPRVSLDQVIATMLETGKNMQNIYKETSLGGLAVNVPEC